jgi:hypothetical protein
MSLFEKTIKVILGKDLDFQVGFIVCGTQKGGTSALDHYLRLHPEICMANKKDGASNNDPTLTCLPFEFRTQ